jgi:hypothetical protein
MENREIYFVVVKSADGWWIDSDSLVARFPDGAVWDQDEEKWISEFDYAREVEQASEELFDLLAKNK